MKPTLKLTALLLFFAASLVSCKDKPEKLFLVVSQTQITVPVEGKTLSIPVSSNGEWTVILENAETESWCTIENPTGVGPSHITVTITRSTAATTRSTTLKITSGKLSRLVTITQTPPITTNTIVNCNSSWATLFSQRMAFGVIYNITTIYTYFDGDSIVDGIWYKKVFTYRDRLGENVSFRGLMREQEKKTYFISASYRPITEFLLYDFSLEEGEIFENLNGQFYVMAVDSIEINGSMRKRMRISRTWYPGVEIDTWIEGMGSLRQLLSPCWTGTGVAHCLLCYFQNGELIYKSPDYSECYYDEDNFPF